MVRALLPYLALVLAPHAAALHTTALDEARVPPLKKLKNITLVLHCRLKAFLPVSICADRKPLFNEYKKYFAEVVYLTRDDCPGSGDPYLCVANVMEMQPASRGGLLYMHFDALIAPRRLSKILDPEAIGTFDPPKTCEVGTDGALVACHWGNWEAKGGAFLKAVTEMHKREEPVYQMVQATRITTGNDDLFYIPSSVFQEFIALSKVFAEHNVHHELAGPIMRQELANKTGRPTKSFNCTGSCCTALETDIATKVSFVCGHTFDLAAEETRNTFKAVISLG